MKIYIAGKITGNPNYKADFQMAEDWHESVYNAILNPATLPYGMDRKDYMSICIQMILSADMVVFLPNYHESDGAKLELQFCQYIGKPYKFLSDDIRFMKWWDSLHEP